jgi:hypothetical protein
LKDSWSDPARAFFRAVSQVIAAGGLPLLGAAALGFILVLTVIGIAIVTGADDAEIQVLGFKVKLHWPRSKPP